MGGSYLYLEQLNRDDVIQKAGVQCMCLGFYLSHISMQMYTCVPPQLEESLGEGHKRYSLPRKDTCFHE